uniref:Uncharacterized protein n=1 Tax=Cucumis melo TaxID=3656 RepID=A0A9I9E1P3_CUCME
PIQNEEIVEGLQFTFNSKDFNLHSWTRPSHIFPKYRSGSELVGGRTKVQSEMIKNIVNALPMSANAHLVSEPT